MEVERFDWKPERDFVVEVLENFGVPIGPFNNYFEAVKQRRLERVGGLLERTASEAQVEPVSLLNAFSDPEMSELLASAIEAAMGSRGKQTVPALARVLAKAMTNPDDAVIDHAHNVVRVLADLEPVDVIALNALEENGTYDGSPPSPDAFKVIAEQLQSDLLASPIQAKLERLALLNPGIQREDGKPHLVTAFGRAVLDYLVEANGAD